jgi:hypothetical protein
MGVLDWGLAVTAKPPDQVQNGGVAGVRIENEAEAGRKKTATLTISSLWGPKMRYTPPGSMPPGNLGVDINRRLGGPPSLCSGTYEY